MQLDDQLEDLKIRLINDNNFYPHSAFQAFAVGSEFASASNILTFIDDRSINIDEVLDMLNFFSTAKNSLMYADFTRMIRPLNLDFATIYDKRVLKE